VIFILGFHLGVWSLALSFSLSSIFQFFILSGVLFRRLPGVNKKGLTISFLKIISAALMAGGTMFVFLKLLDRSVWDKRLSFLGKLGLVLPARFDPLVIDTRYTLNLVFLTFIVGLVGFLVYLFFSYLFKVKEMVILTRILIKIRKLKLLQPRLPKEKESITL